VLGEELLLLLMQEMPMLTYLRGHLVLGEELLLLQDVLVLT